MLTSPGTVLEWHEWTLVRSPQGLMKKDPCLEVLEPAAGALCCIRSNNPRQPWMRAGGEQLTPLGAPATKGKV